MSREEEGLADMVTSLKDMVEEAFHEGGGDECWEYSEARYDLARLFDPEAPDTRTRPPIPPPTPEELADPLYQRMKAGWDTKLHDSILGRDVKSIRIEERED